MSPDLETAVAAYVSRAVGSPVTEVVALAGSVANLDYAVRRADGTRLVVKLGPRSELAAEAWACGRLATLDLPVPEVVGLDLDHGIAGRPTLLLGFLPGAASRDDRVLEQTGAALRRVHTQRLPGWGSVVVAGTGDQVRGRFGSWADAVAHQLAGLPDLVAAGIVEAGLAAAARDLVLVAEIVDRVGTGVLLHNDLKPEHLFADGFADGESGTRLTGIIDWGDATVGDPLADVARLSMAGMDALAAFSRGYGLELTPAVHRILARYRIAWNVAALTYEHRAGGDWFDTYRDRVAADVAGLTRSGTYP